MEQVEQVLVLHHSLNSVGGGERVCLHLLKLLCDHLHLKVFLGTVEPTDWRHVEEITGIVIQNKPVTLSLLPFKLRAFGIYHRVFTGLHTWLLKRKVRLAINTHGDVMAGISDIVYLHFPVLAYVVKGWLKPFLKYYRSTFWRLYFEPYRKMQEKLIKKSFLDARLIITNSRFSRYFIREVVGRDAVVVYPPVELEEYLRLREVRDREDAVIYIARFSLEKNNHVLPLIARELPHIKFYVVGSVAGKGRTYYNYVRRLCEKMGIRNIFFYPNAPHRVKLQLLARSKVYLHLMITEHFGIAPVEAMAAGLVPVVSMLSGTWTDVCDFGRYGLGYRQLTARDIVPLIEHALSRWGRLQAPRWHLERFSTDMFYRKMRKIIEHFLS